MARSDNIEAEGTVTEVMRNTMFKVTLTNGHAIIATISGKLRKNYIKIMSGDFVKIEMSPYDINKGRITYRMK
jgi:translation initiation factor IF-1